MGNTTLVDYAERAQHWLRKHALPLWSSQGIDHKNGGFCELVNFDGKGDSGADKRMLVQCRQMYSFAHANAMGLWDDMTPCTQSLNFLNQYGWSNEGGWQHKVTSQGARSNHTRESYDQAFVLLALGWVHKQQGDKLSQQLLNQTMKYVDTVLKTDTGYHESIPDRQQSRRQNPHMHLFEAFLSLYECTGDAVYLHRADALFDLFTTAFFDAQYTVLREFFTSDWQPDSKAYHRVEPGHMMEWVWLLRQYQRLRPQAVVDTYCHALFHNALAIGYDSKHNVLLDCVDPSGNVLLSSRRCWPQTEGIKASLAQYQCTGDNVYAHTAEALLSSMFQYYLADCPLGGWCDRYDADMQSISTTMPASTLYHVFVCFQQLIQLHGVDTTE